MKEDQRVLQVPRAVRQQIHCQNPNISRKPGSFISAKITRHFLWERENMEAFWQCCRNCKVSPQEPKPLEEKEEQVSKLMREGQLRYGGDSTQFRGVDLESKGTINSAESSGEKLHGLQGNDQGRRKSGLT